MLAVRLAFVLLLSLSFVVRADAQTPSPLSPRTSQVVTALQGWMDAGVIEEPPVLSHFQESVLGLPEPGVPYAPGQEPSLRLMVITEDPLLLASAGFAVGTVAGDVATVEVPLSLIPDLESLPGVTHIQLPMVMSPNLNISRLEVNANIAHGAPIPPYPGVTGEGIVIGVIDTGLDVNHADFQNADGTTRVSYLWDQQDSGGPRPSGYSYGTEWTAAQIDAGVIRQRDNDGHGTHVTAIAAGNGRGSNIPATQYTYTGMAPEAEIIFVKTNFLESSVLDAVSWIQSRAGSKPCVINLSLGSDFGPHDGTAVLDMAMESLSGPGQIIAAAAGNEAGLDRHAEALVAPGATVELPLLVPAYSPNAGAFNDFIFMDGWFPGSADLRITVISPTGLTVGPVGAYQQQQVVTTDGTISIGNSLYPGNGDRNVQIDIFDTVLNPPRAGTWRVRVQNMGPATGEIDVWVPLVYLGSSYSATRWTSFVDPEETVSSPATSNAVLAVGAYVTKTTWPKFGGGACGYAIPFAIGSIAPFSSLGPRRDGELKPEISAPGMGIASARSADALSSIFTDPCARVSDGVHVVSQGTSQSAPHVTGAVALILEGMPNLDFAGVRDRLAETARKDGFTGSVWSPAFGHGKLDVGAATTLPPVVAFLDLHPGSCPNPLNFKQKGVVPVAIVGTENLDVRDIDISTVLLEGVPPLRTSFDDVTEVVEGEACECDETLPDGREDMTLKFSAPEVFHAIMPAQNGDEKSLTLTGNLLDGREFAAVDCVIIRGGPKDGIAPAPGSDNGDEDPDGEQGGTFSLSVNREGSLQHIVYELPEPSEVRLTVYDVTGRVMERLVQTTGSAGSHQVEWNTARQASGIYFYRLEAGERSATRKVVLIQR